MPWSLPAEQPAPTTPDTTAAVVVGLDDDIFAEILDLDEGAVPLAWEQATRCGCYSTDTEQPTWGCPDCGGSGVQYATPLTITGLFRGQSRWLGFRREGEIDHGEASLTTALPIRPGYVDRRVRDRLTVIAAPTDSEQPLPILVPAELINRVFYPAAPATPFIFAGAQRAWRVQLQSAELSQQLNP